MTDFVFACVADNELFGYWLSGWLCDRSRIDCLPACLACLCGLLVAAVVD